MFGQRLLFNIFSKNATKHSYEPSTVRIHLAIERTPTVTIRSKQHTVHTAL